VLGSPKPDITNPDGSSGLQMKGVCVPVSTPSVSTPSVSTPSVSTPSGLCVFIRKEKTVENDVFSSSGKFAYLVTHSDRQCDSLSINPSCFGCASLLNRIGHEAFYSGIPGSYLSALSDTHV